MGRLNRLHGEPRAASQASDLGTELPGRYVGNDVRRRDGGRDLRLVSPTAAEHPGSKKPGDTSKKTSRSPYFGW